MFLHFDKLSIDHDLVELRFHGREQLVQNIAEREVGAVPLKESSPNLIERGAIKNQLRSDDGDAVRYVADLGVSDPWRRRRGGGGGGCPSVPDLRLRRLKERTGCARPNGRLDRVLSTGVYGSGVNEVGISPVEVRLSRDLGQGLRTDLDDHAFGPFDLLFGIEESRIALERHQDRLIKCKRGNLA